MLLLLNGDCRQNVECTVRQGEHVSIELIRHDKITDMLTHQHSNILSVCNHVDKNNVD